ncbi:MAG: hypothetical protein PUG60_07275 [Lachnospiraceae bacterium]|nr:hypothetical protein [Lachnospiraceae bacterium]
MVNIGLDLGSTTTLLSIYDYDANVPKIFEIQGAESYVVPSYVAYNTVTHKYEYGDRARNHMGKKNVTVYRAFKMLLGECDERILKEWNYDENNTPEKITELFIRNILMMVLKRSADNKIGTLTIGIPEIWRKPGRMQRKNPGMVIRRICEDLHLAEQINIVTEPEAASAYFAFKYMEKAGQNFKGNILVIDYGGGTLDITLSEVRPGTADDGTTKYDMQILTKERTGAGENMVDENSSIISLGSGGILYMESVVDAALEEAGMDPVSEKRADFDRYSRLVRMFEQDMTGEQIAIEDELAAYEPTGFQDEFVLAALDETLFTEFEYKEREISITYGMMVRVYNRIIAPVLKEKLQTIINYMDAEHIDFRSGDSDTFQIALAGGFGNFYLVHEQVHRMINVGTRSTIIVGDNECQKTIAFGTALYANNIVGHRYTSPYALGMRLTDAEGESVDAYAFHYREEIDSNKQYFIEIAGRPVTFRSRQDVFRQFIRKDEREDNGTEPTILWLREEYVSRLQGIAGQTGYFRLAFALDEYDRLSIYVYEYDRDRKVCSDTPEVVTLSELNELFLYAESV